MNTRRLPLRTKLLIVLIVPLLTVAFFAALRLQDLRQQSQLAGDQLSQVEENVAVFNVLTSVRAERDGLFTVITNRNGTEAARFFNVTRPATNAAINGALTNPDVSPEVRTFIEQIDADLDVARDLLGTDIRAFRIDYVDEMVGPAEMRSASTSSTVSLAAMNDVVRALIDSVEVDPDGLLDAETAASLSSFDAVLQFDEAVRLEALGYLSLSLLGADQESEVLQAQTLELASGAQAAEATIPLLLVDPYDAELSELIDSSTYTNYRSLRSNISNSNTEEIFGNSFFQTLGFLRELTQELDQLDLTIIEGAQQDALDARSSANQRLVIEGLTAAIVALLVSLIAMSGFRSIRRPLLELTERSHEIASEELPAVVALLREEGHDATVPDVVPIQAETDDEIGDLVDAFNNMHRTAVELAAEQAASRRTVADMFVNLGRRNQKLLTRILSYLDSLEQEERDAEMLEKLFKVDHLATRMRRNAESLLVLAGARASRVFDQPVPVADVARSALAEVEGYERVHLDIRGEASINGEAVADVAHLLAELMENALSFSPPTAPVVVIATNTPGGYYMAVADQGKGMSADEIASANRQISEAVTLEETSSKFLGHHVVGRLAARHGIEVELMPGENSGVTARIMVPSTLLHVDQTDTGAAPEATPALAVTPTAELEAAPDAALAHLSIDEPTPEPATALGDAELSPSQWGEVNALTATEDTTTDEAAPELPATVAEEASVAQAEAVSPIPEAPLAPAALTAPLAPPAPSLPPEGREVLDTSLLPRRRRGADADGDSAPSGSFGDQVAQAERASAQNQRKTDAPAPAGESAEAAPTLGATGANGEFVALSRRNPGATRAKHVAEQPVPEPPSYARLAASDDEAGTEADRETGQPSDIKEAGRAFASSLVGFQQGVTKATGSADNPSSHNDTQPGSQP